MSEIREGDKVFVKKTEKFGSVCNVYTVGDLTLNVRYDDGDSYEYVTPDDVILVKPDAVYTEKSGNILSVYRPGTFERVRDEYRKEKKDNLLKEFRKKAVDPKACRTFTWKSLKKHNYDLTDALYKAAKNAGYRHEIDYEEWEDRENFEDDFRIHDEDDLIAVSKNELYLLISEICKPETLEKAYSYYEDSNEDNDDTDWNAVSVCGSLVAILLWMVLSKKTV